MLNLLFLLALLNADPLSYGKFTVENRHSQTILAAPHGGFDLNTDVLAGKIAEDIKWSSVTAFGFRTREHPLNVNRPTEGIGLPSDKETHSADAERVYEAYKAKILGLAQNPKLYVEIHGEGKLDNRIEIATVGVSEEQAKRLKEILQPLLGEMYEVAIEPADKIHFAAGGAKTFGILHEVPKALHVELPKVLRTEESQRTVRALEAFLPKAAALF